MNFVILSSGLFAQRGRFIEGKAEEQDEHGHRHPLIGANIFWLDTLAGTITDTEGKFQLKRIEGQSFIVVSHVVYPDDTIDVSNSTGV